MAVPQGAVSPALYKVPLPYLMSVSFTVKVQVPLGFSPLKSAKLPSGRYVPLNGARPMPILLEVEASSSNTVS